MLPRMFVRWQGEACERSHVTPRPSPRLSICASAGFCLHSSICAQTERQDAGWAPLGVWFCLSVTLGSSLERALEYLVPWMAGPSHLPALLSKSGRGWNPYHRASSQLSGHPRPAMTVTVPWTTPCWISSARTRSLDQNLLPSLATTLETAQPLLLIIKRKLIVCFG